MFNIIETFKDEDALDLIELINEYITSVLVNPLTERDHTVTWINRLLEKMIFNSLEKKEVFKRGEYYD